MKKSIIFLAFICIATVFASCGSSPKQPVISFDKNCTPFSVAVGETILFQNPQITICDNGKGTSSQHIAYLGKCGNFAEGIWHLEGIEVGATQGSIVQFNTELPLADVAEKIVAQYTAH